ncbi:outer membrane beta-barrel protein [Flagellatimonas centrodinii]|uniref:tetratricopeptide repeat protein n=1 Tax=Flagellatimonas centrodinii TaxID=2806210 RepID=UPI001FEE7688|nr:tetratricopeptide repeat protein [Flagellatimonas centrodinii]ULQ45360.1 outer membrane beta-barrel protein [Flagellatimonas centrodinii]
MYRPLPRLSRRWLPLLGLWIGLAAAQTPGQASFLQGIEAYRSGDYGAALDAFRTAVAAGHQDPNLQFNLGLTHFQLGQWQAAQACFETLAARPAYAAVARYHLALLAARAGHTAAAVDHLQATERLANHPAIRARARAALQRLRSDGDAPAARQYYLYLGSGHDGNPSLISDSVDPDGVTEGRHYAEAFGVVQWPLGKERDLRSSLFARNYPGSDRNDQLGAQVTLRWHDGNGRWQGHQALGLETTQLDHRFMQYLLHVEGVRGRQLGAQRLDLRAQVSGISATGAFQLLSGWRLRTGLQLSRPLGSARGELDLSVAFNERRDLWLGPQFFSQSPVRGEVRFGLAHGTPRALFLQWTLRYRHSHYRHQNRQFDTDGLLQTERRQDDLLSTGLRLRRQLKPSVSLLADYRYDDNASTVPLFDYARSTVSVGIEWQP